MELTDKTLQELKLSIMDMGVNMSGYLVFCENLQCVIDRKDDETLDEKTREDYRRLYNRIVEAMSLVVKLMSPPPEP